MKVLIPLLNIFLYIILVCPISVVLSERGLLYRARDVKEHNHKAPTKPCDACPRHGKCVPKVQCPAHVRPGSYNPVCHIGGQAGLVGVCCFTGHQHAAESDHLPRSVSIFSEDMKKAHSKSKQKLEEWMKQSEKLARMKEVVVNDTAPSFAHHLSVMTYDTSVEELGKGALLNLFTVQELKARDAISDDELQLGFTNHVDGPFCPPQPVCAPSSNRYRSIGGNCNSLVDATWGASKTPFQRLLPPHYGDGLWSVRTASSGAPLPSARAVSGALLLDTSILSPTHNLMFMQFGQFIVHDVSAGVVFTVGNGSAISCCIGDGQDYQPPELSHWACDPVSVAPDDDFYRPFGHKCLNFVRTQLAPNSDCSVGYANPMNGATHHIDLSHIYGSTPEKVFLLRGPGGLLNTLNDFGRELPPLTERKECLSAKSGAACFESGDNHGNQVISLTILHTIWTREHNRVASTLARLNPGWDEDRLFLETRRILQAEFQNIVYQEWLPMLLGPHLIQAFGLTPLQGFSSSHKPDVNPSLTAEFSAAAMRFGHSVVDGRLVVPSSTRSDGLYETISLPEVMFQPSRLRIRPFMDRLINGLSYQPMQNVDPFVSESLTRYLFHGGNPYGLDLASINIQRGRDYGLRPYNDYRKLIGLEPFVDFAQFSPNAAQRLSSVYQNPEDIDLWIGGLMEEPVPGSLVGATFAHIIADQFSRTKHGDRYFYDNGPDVNPGAFTASQLAEIKKVTLARLLCDNRDGIELLQVAPNAFLRADLPGNEPVPCESPRILSMDLNRFREI